MALTVAAVMAAMMVAGPAGPVFAEDLGNTGNFNTAPT